MGGGPKAPDNSAQLAELERQRKQAEATADKLAQDNLDETNARRRRQYGKSLLIGTSEFGTSDKLGK